MRSKGQNSAGVLLLYVVLSHRKSCVMNFCKVNFQVEMFSSYDVRAYHIWC